MVDYLKAICENLGIKLLYTENNLTVLSTDFVDGKPILSVNKILEFCPESVAIAVIRYNIEYENAPIYEKEIFNFINNINQNADLTDNNRTFIKDMVQPGSTTTAFKRAVLENLPLSGETGTETSLLETEITDLIIKDFWNREKMQNHNDPFLLEDGNILELDIKIKPLDTYERR